MSLYTKFYESGHVEFNHWGIKMQSLLSLGRWSLITGTVQLDLMRARKSG